MQTRVDGTCKLNNRSGKLWCAVKLAQIVKLVNVFKDGIGFQEVHVYSHIITQRWCLSGSLWSLAQQGKMRNHFYCKNVCHATLSNPVLLLCFPSLFLFMARVHIALSITQPERFTFHIISLNGIWGKDLNWDSTIKGCTTPCFERARERDKMCHFYL